MPRWAPPNMWLAILILLSLPVPIIGGSYCPYFSEHKENQEDNVLFSEKGCIKDTDSKFQFAVCLTQRNSLRTVLGCANYKPNEYLWWPSQRSKSKLDLVPPHYKDEDGDYLNDNKDNIVAVTPRGVLIALARLMPSECRNTDLEHAFTHCPQRSLGAFLSCICCHFVNETDIKEFEKCIWKPRLQYTSVPLTPISWFCRSKCNDYRKVNHLPPKSYAALDIRNRRSNSEDVESYFVENGRRLGEKDVFSDKIDPEGLFNNTIDLRSLTSQPPWTALGHPVSTQSENITNTRSTSGAGTPNTVIPTATGASGTEDKESTAVNIAILHWASLVLAVLFAGAWL